MKFSTQQYFSDSKSFMKKINPEEYAGLCKVKTAERLRAIAKGQSASQNRPSLGESASVHVTLKRTTLPELLRRKLIGIDDRQLILTPSGIKAMEEAHENCDMCARVCERAFYSKCLECQQIVDGLDRFLTNGGEHARTYVRELLKKHE